MTQDITATLEERGKRSGEFKTHAEITMALKRVMATMTLKRVMAGRASMPLADDQREALDMIAHKIARILSGADPHDSQHWEDVAGYAQAAMRGQQQ